MLGDAELQLLVMEGEGNAVIIERGRNVVVEPALLLVWVSRAEGSESDQAGTYIQPHTRPQFAPPLAK
jgi:hypothetical protein